MAPAPTQLVRPTFIPILPPDVPKPTRMRGHSGGFFSGLMRYWFLRAVISLLVLGGGAAYRLATRSDDAATSGDATSAPASIDYPETWDTRVLEMVRFVETNRGLTFEHPIDVEFLPESDFLKLVDPSTPAEDDPDADEAADQFSATQNALGLSGDYDVAASNTTVSTAILGFYDSDFDSVVIRGSELTPAVRVVLAHELTHALQAQRFDLPLGGPADLQVRAIAEADAMRIEELFAATLPEPEHVQADAENTIDAETADDLDGVPWTLVAQRYAPYVLGPSFLEYILAHGGNAAVDDVFRDVPTQKELLTPALYGSHVDDAAVVVTAPASATPLGDAQPWGMFDAVTMLDAWLPWQVARRPFDGWSGGARIAFEQYGVVCVATSAEFVDDRSTQLFVDAVTAWSQASGTNAAPAPDGRRVSFTSCERGGDASTPPRPLLTPAESVVVETMFVQSLLEQGLDDAVAHCVARATIDDPVLEPLWFAAELTADENTVVAQRSEDATVTCLTQLGG